ncbi:hypothetical protein PUN28_000123 [Cardiocondyla obscurior]|uniref:Uncharacterized protein n=1 Tax=Cardiocondyla obscurior TaxID=286306 RepID=A0AAW2GXW7_9HYME
MADDTDREPGYAPNIHAESTDEYFDQANLLLRFKKESIEEAELENSRRRNTGATSFLCIEGGIRQLRGGGGLGKASCFSGATSW